MATVYAIFDPGTGLYSRGWTNSHQTWTTPDEARTFTTIGHARNHINRCIRLWKDYQRYVGVHQGYTSYPSPYSTGIQIVELQVQFVPVKVAATL